MPTLDQLNQLANAVPVMNQKAAKAAQGQAQVTADNQVAAAPAQASGVRAAQGLAGTMVNQQAQPVLQANEQTQSQLNQIGNMGLQTQASNAEADLAHQSQVQQTNLATQDTQQKLQLSEADLAMRKRVTANEQASAQRLQTMGIEVDNNLQLATIRQRQQLDRLGGDVRAKILDARLQFQRDDMGRKFSNERQLADYSIQNAQSEQDLNDKMREAEQTSDRKVQLLQMANARISQTLMEGFNAREQQLDDAQKAKLAQMKADMEQQIRKEQAAAHNRQMMWQGAGMVVGAVAGAVIGGGLTFGAGAGEGAVLGASLGGGVGTMAGSAAEANGVK